MVHSFVSKTNYERTNNVSALAATGLGGKEFCSRYLLYCVTVSLDSLIDLCKLFRVTDDQSKFVFSLHYITTP